MPKSEPDESGARWWFRYVIVPLIGTGGLGAIVVAVLERPARIPSVTSSPAVTTNGPNVSAPTKESHEALKETGARKLQSPESPAPAKDDLHPKLKVSSADPRGPSLTLEYDSLKERFSAVNQSLTQRGRDLGNVQIKPEIASALGTTKDDLAAIERALRDRDFNVATERIERVKKTLSYLESL